MKIDWQWPPAVAYCVSCLVLGGLVYKGIIHPEALFSLIAWLAPGPWQWPAPKSVDPPAQ